MNLEPKVKTAIDAESPHSSPQLILVTDQRKMFLNLPDEMIVHMCYYMDSYTLLKFGRCSSRLYNIVCSPEVWRRLLKGIEDFREAKVRMLMLFARKGDFLNMMTEVLREIASRNTFSKGEDKVRLSCTIGGWSAAETYELRSNALRRLHMVEEESALVVPRGARMIVNEVKEFEGSKHDETCFFYHLCNHVKMQPLEVNFLEVARFGGHWDNLDILRKCKTWLIHEFQMLNWREPSMTVDMVHRHWRYMARCADGGNIKMLLFERHILPDTESIYKPIQESVRKVWEISLNVKIMLEDRSNVLLRAGRNNDNRDEHWQQLMEALQLGVS